MQIAGLSFYQRNDSHPICVNSAGFASKVGLSRINSKTTNDEK